MRPKEVLAMGATDLFRSRPDQIIDMRHALVKLVLSNFPASWIEVQRV